MIKVYATCFWQSDAELLSDITKYGFGNARWKNLVFTDSKDFDVAVVLTAPWSECHDFAPNRAIRFLTEPPALSHHRDVADTLCPMYLPLPWWINSARLSEIVKVSIIGKTKSACFAERKVQKLFEISTKIEVRCRGL